MRIPLLLLSLAVGACSNPVDLAYAPPPDLPQAGAPEVGSVTTVDTRGESDPNWIGAIRGGYGNALKVLQTSRPLPDVVSDAVRAGLQARGLLGTAAAPYTVKVTIEELKSDQYVRREADITFRFDWMRQGSATPAFTNHGKSVIVAGSALALDSGVFGSVDKLRELDARAISAAIDQALDDPELRSFLSHPVS